MPPPIATSWLSRAGGTGSPPALPANVWEAGGGMAGEMGRCTAGWMDQVSRTEREKIEIPPREPFLLLEGALKGCFKRFLQWTEEEEDMLEVQAHVAFRYVHGAFRDSLIYLRCKR